jgi:hypothetical protein
VVFYSLCLTLVVLLQRPRIVVYNVSAEQLRAALSEVAIKLDLDARMAGDSLCLPNLGVQMHIEPLPALKNVQLKSSGPQQSYQGWREVELALHGALVRTRGVGSPYAISFLLVGLTMLGLATLLMAYRGDDVAQAWHQMMRDSQD